MLMRIIILISAVFLLTSCGEPEKKTVTLRGSTMGTTYQVKIIDLKKDITPEQLHNHIKATLEEVNNNLSNWQKSSEISKFNRSEETSPQTISDDFAAVMAESYRIHQLTNGRFDVTLAPLIKLWGFGSKNQEGKIPPDAAINEALTKVGMTKLLKFEENASTLRKLEPKVTINLSAIAKGYGVDRVARTIEKHGARNYLVEIGGDLYGKGLNAKGKPWVIGIEKPDIKGRTVQAIVKVSNKGTATSGDYRNYIEKDGKRYSHIIDPVTGRPITHNLASVTVLSDNGMRADGLATALFVLGDEEGLKLAEEHKIAAFFIIREGGKFIEKSSSAYKALAK